MNAPRVHEFDVADARAVLSSPRETDDKYSRGVVGFVTGSSQYPGAAVLGVSGAYRVGVGLVRYVGPADVGHLVLQARPETVLREGHVDAWVIGSGQLSKERAPQARSAMNVALTSGLPTVVDAGALDLVREAATDNRIVITPHATELARLMSENSRVPGEWTLDLVGQDPAGAAQRAADDLGVVVCLKGFVTNIATPGSSTQPMFQVTSPTTWLATAGTGDVLAGVMGAILATSRANSHAEIARAAACAAFVHGRAAGRASSGGPLVALDVADALPHVIREVLTA